MSTELAEFLKTALTVGGAMVAAWLTAWLTRLSQKESTQITALTSLIDQLQEERDSAKKEAKQIPLWRRYTQSLRKQIYKMGGSPVDPDKELEL
jgi:hypothetical protein